MSGVFALAYWEQARMSDQYCLCGCGEVVRQGRRYAGSGHALEASRKSKSPEHRAKIAAANTEYLGRQLLAVVQQQALEV